MSLTLSPKMYSGHSIGDGKERIWLGVLTDHGSWEMFADMITGACDLLHIRCFSVGRQHIRKQLWRMCCSWLPVGAVKDQMEPSRGHPVVIRSFAYRTGISVFSVKEPEGGCGYGRGKYF